MASQLTNPLLYQTREGSLEDPYVDKVESVKPVNGRAVLEEVPVKEFGVIVDNYIEKATNTPTGIEFYVDYTNGVLYFEPTLDATVTVRYKGRGVVLIPAERIYYGDAETNETLDVSLTSLQSLAGTYEEEIQLTNEATGLATQATAFAQEQGEYALAQGDYAKALGLEAKGNAEAAVGSALAARDEALEKAQLADEAARTVKVDWLDPVQTFADLATTYPNPTETNQVQVLDTGYIYRFKNGLWDTHLFSPVHPSELARHTDRFIATQGQTVFDTSKPYFTNQDRIDVYVSGVKQASGIDFNETSPTRITLTTGCEAGEIVETVYLKTTEAQALDLIEQVQAAEAATTAATSAKNEALSAATSTKLIWKDPVANFAALATTYPTATEGWTAATKDNGKIYRKNATEWKLIQEVDLTAYNALDTKVTAQLADIANKTGWMGDAFSGMRLVAHRGYSQYYPENTLKAYVEADKAGFFAWETDPWVTTDGVWFNMHDSTVDRTTNGTGGTASFNLAQIKAMKIDGGNGASVFRGLSVPTIEEIYKLASKMDNKPYIFLNNRTTTPIDEPRTIELANIIKKYNYEKMTILFTGTFSSFDGLRNLLPEVGICCDFGDMNPTNEQLNMLAAYAPNAMASVDYTVLLANPTIFDRCRSRGLFVQAHTVNGVADARTLTDLGVNSILTDVITGVY